MRIAAAIWIALVLVGLVFWTEPTIIGLLAGVVIGGPLFGWLGWTLHTYDGSGPDPFAVRKRD